MSPGAQRPVCPLQGVREFLAREELRLAPSSFDSRKRSLRRFERWLKNCGIEMADLEAWDFADYLSWLQEVSPGRQEGGLPMEKTLVQELSNVRIWLKFLFEEGLLLRPLHLDVPRMKECSRLPRPLSVAEVEEWLALCDLNCPLGLRDRAFLETVYGTGLRNSELCGVRFSDLDLGEAIIDVNQSKNGDSRRVPLTERALGWLGSYLKKSRPVLAARGSGCYEELWLGFTGKPMKSKTFSRRVAKLYRPRLKDGHKIGIHVLRHSYATHLLQGGADPRHLGELLGHRSLKSVMLYTKVMPSDLQQMFKAHPRSEPKSETGSD